MYINVMSDKTIYLDNAASTPLRPEVLAAMLPHLQNSYGNPSSIHHKGLEAHTLLEHARESVARSLVVKPTEIVFTSGGTEANNLALYGVAHAYSTRGKHILLSAVEHPSILNAGEVLTREGFDVEYLPVNQYGEINITNTLARVRNDTILISVMLANNEIGTIQPIEELSRALRARESSSIPIFHTDACQATGQIPICPHTLGVDLMTINSSKIYGPKGIGLLYVREDISLCPVIVGGHQESGKRAGTENLPNIIGFAKALELASNEQQEHSALRTILRDSFISLLKEKLPQVTLNGQSVNRLPNNVHISLPNIEGESLVLMLDTYGICTATGSACSAHNLLPSHVLRAIGQPSEIIHGSLRFSLGRNTTREDLVYTVNTLSRCVERLEAMSPLPLHL
jgi:cysteine desulfurase